MFVNTYLVCLQLTNNLKHCVREKPTLYCHLLYDIEKNITYQCAVITYLGTIFLGQIYFDLFLIT